MKIFKNDKLQKQFDRDGYVTLPLIDLPLVNELANLYSSVQPVSFKGFSSTIYNQDVALKKKTSDAIFRLLNEQVKNHFQDFRPLGCSFLCKTPGEDSFMPVHQDWTVVDETKFASVTIWIPLCDVDEKNGAMRVLPGSHRFSDALRSPTLPGAFQSLNDEIYRRMKWVKVKAGEAVIFNHALLHASPPNLSNSDRVIATYGLVPKDAELVFYHRNENGKVEKYTVPDNFFITYNHIGSAPTNGKLKETIEYENIVFDLKQLERAMQHYNKQKNENMKPLFKDPEVQSFFNKNGFARLKMLDEQDVKTLYDFYFEQNLRDHSGYGFNMSIEDDDKEKVAFIRKKILEVALPKALPHFVENAKVIASSFVVKEKNPQGVVPPHQDWTFVEDEGENYSVTCWIPLVPTNRDNGYMGVIKGSHLIYDNIRPSPSPQVPTPLMNHLFSIFPYLEMFEMQPGEALIFDQRTFHASTPNITDTPRVAIGLGFTQGDSKLCHYNLKQNGKKDTLLKYAIDDDFLLKYNNTLLSRMFDTSEQIEGYEIVEEIPFVCPNPTSEELLEQIKAAGNVFNVELCEHMAKLFNFNVDGLKKEEAPAELEPQMEAVGNESQPQENAKPFWQVYTPMNILREIKFRVTGN